ncbi:pirin family protein [Chitinispirillales bacterium ANBcel5]|uniref:pirin family protein n=1 Tax=Cellulosispirillum alkaliphilum TaxID=3039283 RepID=UPI002A573279|nr:pirin family protein [Chitinispirillales bacterium ANBcel5]
METSVLLSAEIIAEGEGARVKRLFPSSKIRDFDPFVLFDEFFVDPFAGFPEHPHRGFEAITYMLEGSFRHKDTLGNDTEVGQEGVQRFTAGRGILHSEMPGRGVSVCHGIQLWLNLPKRLKHIEPSYQQVDKGNLTVFEVPGGTVRTVIGDKSPLKVNTTVSYFDIRLRAGYSYSPLFHPQFSSFIYVYRGKVLCKGLECGSGQGITLKLSPGDIFKAVDSSGFLFLTGKPHREPIYHNGPYVD